MDIDRQDLPFAPQGAMMRALKPLPPFPNDTYVAVPFEATRIIERLHNWPRYGLTNNIGDLATGTSDQQKDYIIGIVTGSLIILGVAIVWLLILLLLKCCGKRVGCASGKPRPPKRPTHANFASAEPSQAGFEVADVPKQDSGTQEGSQEATDQVTIDQGTAGKVIEVDEANPSNAKGDGLEAEQKYNLAIEDWQGKMKRHERALLMSRITLMLAGFVAIVASILFFAKGAGALLDSISSVQTGLDYAGVVMTNGINVSTTFVRAQELVNEEKVEFTEGVTFCNTSVEANSAAAEIQELINDLALVSSGLTSEFVELARNLAVDLREAREISYEISSSLDKVKPWFAVAIVFSAILDIIILSLMMSTGLLWAGRKPTYCHCFFRCLRNILVIPVLIIFMFLAWFFCSAFVIAAVAAADFCINPDEHILGALEGYQNRFSDDSIVFEFIKYYVSACDASFEPFNIPDMLPEGFEAAVNAVHAVLEYGMTSTELAEALSSICSQNAERVSELAFVLHNQLHVLWGALIGVYQVLSCSSMNPIYAFILHDGVCTDAVNGLGWIFFTMLTIAVCCMTMITVRASWYEVEKEAESKVGVVPDDDLERAEDDAEEGFAPEEKQ